MNESLQSLAEMKYQESKDKFPGVPDYAIPKTKYTDKTANDLTRCIMDFIKVTGGHAERINTMGRVIKQGGRSKYIPTTGTRGSADIHSMKGGRFIAIEIKIGADRQSIHQKKYQLKIEQGGGIYIIAKNFENFVEQWQQI